MTFEQFLPMLQTVSGKKITDTTDDFVEGLRHFDKVKLFNQATMSWDFLVTASFFMIPCSIICLDSNRENDIIIARFNKKLIFYITLAII